MTGLPPGWRVIELGKVESTQDEARRLAGSGAPNHTVLIADSQTSGRGRRGRNWVSPSGNLHCSILLRGIERPHELSFVVGLAVADALDAHAAGVALKWPNDVLIDGAKVAGILIEMEGQAAIVGIGINLAHHPDDAAYRAVDLGGNLTPKDLLPGLATALAERLDEWKTLGFRSVREGWLERAWRLGARVTVEIADSRERETGAFAGIDESGALLLDPGLRPIISGSVRYR
jgi:BirA family biotin operon repressor/biotin-[acetyl-CoA-carboxylase] ligase